MKLQYLSLLLISVFFIGACKGGKKAVKTMKTYKMLDEKTFLITKVATDETYGFTQDNPIKVGGTEEHSGPASERYYLAALLGPEGQEIEYKRTGSCCEFKTENGFEGGGLLDQYEVTWDGATAPKLLFINMYDYGELKIPNGFTAKKDH